MDIITPKEIQWETKIDCDVWRELHLVSFRSRSSNLTNWATQTNGSKGTIQQGMFVL